MRNDRHFDKRKTKSVAIKKEKTTKLETR